MTAIAPTVRAAPGSERHFRELATGVPLFESPFFERFVGEAFPDSAVREIAVSLNRDGFAIIDFPDDEFVNVADRIRAGLNDQYNWAAWRNHGYHDGAGMRVQDAWYHNADVRRLATNGALLSLLSRLYGRRMWPFQTLNFPVGTQQHFHSDSVHFSTLPERFMCGVWAALEDVKEDAGPLVYYPGSHKLPLVYNETIGYRIEGDDKLPTQAIYEEYWRAIVEQSGIEPAYFTPRKGQALIWAANLLHGGARQTNPDATRWSQVTHYYGDDCVYLTPMLSDMPTGNVFYRAMIDVSTGHMVENRNLGGQLAPGTPIMRDTRQPRQAAAAAAQPVSGGSSARYTVKKALSSVGLLTPAQKVKHFAGRVTRRVKRTFKPAGAP